MYYFSIGFDSNSTHLSHMKAINIYGLLRHLLSSPCREIENGPTYLSIIKKLELRHLSLM